MDPDLSSLVTTLASRLDSVERDRDRLLSYLYGTSVYSGPCAHGTTYWNKCEICSKGTSLDAAVLFIKHELSSRNTDHDEHTEQG